MHPMASRPIGTTANQNSTSDAANASTNAAAVDWSLGPPAQSNCPRVPVILQYSVHSLATLKPPSLQELVEEAATEFGLDANAIHLAILINQAPIKISHTLYAHIGPFSTIHVQPSPMLFSPLPTNASASAFASSSSLSTSPLSAPTTAAAIPSPPAETVGQPAEPAPASGSQKRFLINSRASSSQRRAKFPFLKNRQSDASCASSSPPAATITGAPDDISVIGTPHLTPPSP